MIPTVLQLGSPLHQLLPVHEVTGRIGGFRAFRSLGPVRDLWTYRYAGQGEVVRFDEAQTVAVVVLAAERRGGEVVSRAVVEQVDLGPGGQLVGPIAWKLLEPQAHAAPERPRPRRGILAPLSALLLTLLAFLLAGCAGMIGLGTALLALVGELGWALAHLARAFGLRREAAALAGGFATVVAPARKTWS